MTGRGWPLRLVALTLLVAALRVTPGADGLTVELTGRFFGELLVINQKVVSSGRLPSKAEVKTLMSEALS